MGLNLYFYRCKKDYYEQLSHDSKALSAETQAAGARWMQQQLLQEGPLDWFNKYGDPTPTEDYPVIQVGQWLSHVGAAYRWLVEHTELTMADVYPVAISCEAMSALCDACKTVTSLKLNADGGIDADVCEQYLPAIDEANCEYYQPAMGPDYFGTSWYGEEYQEEALSVLDTLTILLKIIDIENEVILVQASW